MSSINRDHFLHFLDRELLETQGVYDKILAVSISRDVRFVLLNTIGDLILSASFLFESKYAYTVFNEFFPFFSDGKFIIALTYDSLKKMISKKQDQYKGKESLFPNYFNDLWHIFEESGVVLFPKKTDTTLYIASKMTNTIQTNNLIQATSDIPYIIEAIEKREKRAITHHLFTEVYNKRTISDCDQESINSLITESYIKSYMDYFDATVPMGLSCGIYQYDYLCDNFPMSDISFWIKLYKRIGLYHFVCRCKTSTLLEISQEPSQHNFLKSVSHWISCLQNYNNVQNNCFNIFYSYVNQLPQFSEIMVEKSGLYFKRISVVAEILFTQDIFDTKRRFANMNNKEKTVFVVHGRNQKIKKALFEFLRSLNLYPLEWESAVRMTKKGTPTTLEVINEGMRNSKGIIILFTGDDIAKLKEEFCEVGENNDMEPQPRQNVIFEAGMAMALYQDSTIIVRVGGLREISDLAGINYVNLTNSPEKRQAFITRLNTIGLGLDMTGSDWISAGDFTV